MKTDYDLSEEIEFYFLNNEYRKLYLLWCLFANALRIIHSVYIFRNFDEYCIQLLSDRNENKSEIYWNVSYYEKLIDYIKIITAFETFNKALLIRKGILIYKIDKRYNRKLEESQRLGNPITIDEFCLNNYTNINVYSREASLNGLISNRSTINFSHTINDKYQKIIRLDEQLIHYLKDINSKRNRLHLYSDFTGAFEVNSHIAKWKFIKENSITVIKRYFDEIDMEFSKL